MRPIRNMPIKQKLMAIIMLVATAALLFSGVLLIISDLALFRSGLQKDLTALAQIVSDNSTASLAFDDPQTAEETLSALKARSHVQAACIYRENGKLLASYSPPGAALECNLPPSGGNEVRFTNAAVLVRRNVVLKGRQIGTLVLVYDLEEMYQRMRIYGLIVLAVLLASSLVAFLISSKLREIIATPISQLAQTTTSVSKTRDYSIRAQKLSGDELGVLVEGFNEMLASIQSRDKELQEALGAREAALREAQSARDSLTTTLASIGDAVISTDSAGRVVFSNPVAWRMLHCEERDITGQRVEDVMRLVHEQTRASIENPICRVLRENRTVGLANHTVLIAADGTEVPIDDSAAPIRNAAGELVGVVLVFRDITERRRADHELRSAREQLQLVTDTMAPAVTHCNRDLKYVWVSRRYAEWLNSTPAALTGRALQDVLGTEALAAMQPNIDRVLSGERVEFEAHVNVSPIGVRWIRAAYVPTYDEVGGVTGWVADVADITVLKNAEAEVVRINADLHKSNERLARSNEDLERFAFVASHDLQEPLRMITTYAQLFARTHSGRMDDEASTLVRNIIDATKRMRELLVDLLSYTELSADPDEPARTVDMNRVLETVQQNLRAAIDESGAAIVTEELPTLTGHEVHFISLFQNLIGNAIKYRSEERPRIRVAVHQIEGDLRFSVADNGMGIDPEYHEKVFAVFKRLHGKKIPGTGVGLAICQRVVERYGGRIWVESREGQGATFFFTLPDIAVHSAGRVQ